MSHFYCFGRVMPAKCIRSVQIADTVQEKSRLDSSDSAFALLAFPKPFGFTKKPVSQIKWIPVVSTSFNACVAMLEIDEQNSRRSWVAYACEREDSVDQ
jgi:hypothetical protein